jgi:hypothetical protein
MLIAKLCLAIKSCKNVLKYKSLPLKQWVIFHHGIHFFFDAF